MTSINITSPQHQAQCLLCFICQDLFCKPQTVSCGHTFCYLCLDQYLLYCDICPVCSKSIRGKPIHPVPCLSEFIFNSIKNDFQEIERLESRNEMAKEYMKKREVRGIKVGMMLDIRDANDIWCLGMVVRVINRYEQPIRLLRISYINYLQKKEEDVPMNSDRLASKGFYTNRKEIPHYGNKPTSSIIHKYQI